MEGLEVFFCAVQARWKLSAGPDLVPPPVASFSCPVLPVVEDHAVLPGAALDLLHSFSA